MLNGGEFQQSLDVLIFFISTLAPAVIGSFRAEAASNLAATCNRIHPSMPCPGTLLSFSVIYLNYVNVTILLCFMQYRQILNISRIAIRTIVEENSKTIQMSTTSSDKGTDFKLIDEVWDDLEC